MAESYSALILASNVESEAQGAYQFDLGSDSTKTTLQAMADEVTGIIEGALDRHLIVRKYTHYFDLNDWSYDRARQKYVAYTYQWPIVQVDTSGFTAASSRGSSVNNILEYTSAYCGAVTYYAGYKRSEQTLTNLQAQLADLAELPADLPGEIRGVAISAALHALAERRAGPGQRTRTLNAAVQTSVIQETLRDYTMRIVKERIYHHARLR